MERRGLLDEKGLTALLEVLTREYRVIAPVPLEGGAYGLAPLKEADPSLVDLAGVRPYQPLKSFFLRPRQRVAEDFRTRVPDAGDRPFCLLGAKACDLSGMDVQDAVFLEGEFRDPFYGSARERNLIVTSDCGFAADTCFCTAMGGAPYAERGFDLNVSVLPDCWLLEAGSSAGESLMERLEEHLAPAGPESLKRRQMQRERVTAEVGRAVEEAGAVDQDRLEGVISEAYESPVWREEADRCVECGACNTICPTCHCFLLYDQMLQAGEEMEKLRVWDSCLLKGFARVAGGENPRPELWMRLRNRFEKKFDFFPRTEGIYACTGCGRCIACCPAEIDIREVLRRLVEDAR